MTNFKKAIKAAGFTGEREQFYQRVAELFATHFAVWKTEEQLKRHPLEALRFCNLVRGDLGLPHLADDIILGALENHRKHLAKA